MTDVFLVEHYVENSAVDHQRLSHDIYSDFEKAVKAVQGQCLGSLDNYGEVWPDLWKFRSTFDSRHYWLVIKHKVK